MKLTDEQKLANKNALRLKRQAHAARRALYQARDAALVAERVASLTTPSWHFSPSAPKRFVPWAQSSTRRKCL